MKKTLSIILALAMLCVLPIVSACGKTAAKDVITGTSSEVVDQIIDKSDAELGMLMSQEITSENCQDLTGLSPEDFAQYVSDATASMAMININAHLMVVLKAKDIDSAAKVKELAAKGFNSMRWCCVQPDKSLVVDSGSYVLLVASNTESADALVNGFKTLAGDTMGSVNTFFTAEQ